MNNALFEAERVITYYNIIIVNEFLVPNLCRGWNKLIANIILLCVCRIC